MTIDQAHGRATEAGALLAVLDGDERQCQALLSGMSSNELHELWGAVNQLRFLAVAAYLQAKDEER